MGDSITAQRPGLYLCKRTRAMNLPSVVNSGFDRLDVTLRIRHMHFQAISRGWGRMFKNFLHEPFEPGVEFGLL